MRGIENYSKADIDVVVLSYNHAQYIDQNIQSILSQKTNYRFNLLIADDCSSDGTRLLVKKWVEQDQRVFLIETPRNLGSVENARNVIALCQSDYLAFCEGDDFWLNEDKLQSQMDFLQGNPGFGMVHGDVCYYHESKKKLSGSVNGSKGIEFPTGNIFREYLVNDQLFIFTASVLVERKLFVQAADYDLFKSKKWLAQDLPTWLAIAQTSKVGYMDRIMAAYRLADESASRSKSAEYTHRFHQSIFDIRYHFWREYFNDNETKEKIDLMYSLALLSDIRQLRSRKLWIELWDFKRRSNFRWSAKRWFQFFYLFFIALICGK